MQAIPNEFLCPITMEEMTDPVIGSDGHTYERSAILRALGVKGVSPMTREPMNVSSLKPNYALKASLDRWKKEQNGSAPKTKGKTTPEAKAKTKAKTTKSPDQPIIITYNSIPPITQSNDIDYNYAIMIQEEEKTKKELEVAERQVKELKAKQDKAVRQFLVFFIVCCVVFLIIMISR
jgi:hypothetical protein